MLLSRTRAVCQSQILLLLLLALSLDVFCASIDDDLHSLLDDIILDFQRVIEEVALNFKSKAW